VLFEIVIYLFQISPLLTTRTGSKRCVSDTDVCTSDCQ